MELASIETRNRHKYCAKIMREIKLLEDVARNITLALTASNINCPQQFQSISENMRHCFVQQSKHVQQCKVYVVTLMPISGLIKTTNICCIMA